MNHVNVNHDKGVIFKYTDRNGNVVKAVALHSDQKPEFSNYRKVFPVLIHFIILTKM